MPGCYQCGFEWEDLSYRPSRQDRCDQCGADVRCCYNCQFYDESKEWECAEEIPEPVKEKAKANFCEMFKLRKSDAGKEKINEDREAILSAAESLFKKKEGKNNPSAETKAKPKTEA